ncbi:hypothetical protein ACHAW6_000543 [Cyclotella cf. meneghiniana]
MSGLILLPSDTANALLTSLTNVMAAVPASRWSMDSAAREAGSSASATMTCTTNGPTSAALLSPTSSVNNVTPTTWHTANPTNTLGDEACGDVLAHGF